MLNNLARLARHNGRFTESQDYFEQAISLAQTKNDQKAILNAFKDLGILATQQGALETAVMHFEQAMSIAETLLVANIRSSGSPIRFRLAA